MCYHKLCCVVCVSDDILRQLHKERKSLACSLLNIRDNILKKCCCSFGFFSKLPPFCQKCPSLRPKKWHFEWPNQNSETTFIVQTFPKYGLYDFYLVNLSLLGAILAIFQFCGFSGLFWPFFPCK